MGSAERWRLNVAETGLRLSRLRAFGSAGFTWADLLQRALSSVRVFVLYFPSRFDLPVDTAAAEALRRFGEETPHLTSINFWDSRDEHFSSALSMFGVRNPPALVLVTGLQVGSGEESGKPTLDDSLYCISFTDSTILEDRARMATAVNLAHEILMRCDRREIANYVRGRKAKALLSAVGRGTGRISSELAQLHPVFGLPGGFSIEIG